MPTRSTWLVLAALPLTCFAACSTPSIRAGPSVGFANLDGDFAASSGSISASNDFSDLGLDDRETEIGARVDLKWGSPHLTVSFARTEMSGDGTTTAQLENDGVIIPVGASVDSDVELTHGQAVITFDLLPTDMFELGLGVGVEALAIDGTIEDTGSGDSIETDETAPIPVIAARAGFGLGPVDVSLLATGMDLEIDGDEVSFFDFDLRGSVSLFSHGELVLGYRRWEADLEYDDDGDRIAADFTLDGPYIGFSLSF
jgi:hypothetical protein